VERVDALYVGNMCSGTLNGQEHLGALISDWVGLRGVEAVKVEAACGSGAAALRLGYVAVAGELADFVVVAGVEKMTDRPGEQVTAALAMASDGDFEAQNGLSFVALNALLMRRYMHEYGVSHRDFAPFAINAHKNAKWQSVCLVSACGHCRGFLRGKDDRRSGEPARQLTGVRRRRGGGAVPHRDRPPFTARPVRIRASSAATDTIALHDRRDLLGLEGAALSASKAYKQAKVTPRYRSLRAARRVYHHVGAFARGMRLR
jgi:acetyl-CoA C-acetyltransferase